MQLDDIRSNLTEVFRDVLGHPDLDIREEMTAADVAGWDSLAHLSLIFETETRFGVTFVTREVQALRGGTVGDLIALIARKTQ